MREELYQFIHEYDYRKNVIGTGGTFVYSADGETLNTYSYVSGNGKIYVDTATYGWFQYQLQDLKIGDIIEVECEMRSVSGVAPRLAIHRGTFDVAGEQIFVRPETTEWELVRTKYIVEQDNLYLVSIGFTTTDAGKAEFRNWTIKVKANSKSIQRNTISDGTTHNYNLDAHRTKQFEFFNGSGTRTIAKINTIRGGLVGDVVRIVKGSYDITINIEGTDIIGSYNNEGQDYRVYELLKTTNGTWIIQAREETAWIDLSLSTGWANSDSTGVTDPKLQYKREGERIYIRGIIKQSLSAANVNICTIPVDVRPKSTFLSNIVAVQDGVTDKFLGLQIASGILKVRVGTIELNKFVGVSICYDID